MTAADRLRHLHQNSTVDGLVQILDALPVLADALEAAQDALNRAHKVRFHEDEHYRKFWAAHDKATDALAVVADALNRHLHQNSTVDGLVQILDALPVLADALEAAQDALNRAHKVRFHEDEHYRKFWAAHDKATDALAVVADALNPKETR